MKELQTIRHWNPEATIFSAGVPGLLSNRTVELYEDIVEQLEPHATAEKELLE